MGNDYSYSNNDLNNYPQPFIPFPFQPSDPHKPNQPDNGKPKLIDMISKKTIDQIDKIINK